jgi:hypothetical protein
MKTILTKLSLFAFVFSMAFIFSSCSEDEGKPILPLEATVVTNIAANPTADANNNPIPPTNKFTLFSLRENKIIPNSDSATAKWDVGFRSTTVIFNGGSSGPGNGQAQVMTGIFDELLVAPETGYKVDAAPTYAVPTGSNNGWYTYTGSTGTPPNTILPLAGKYIAVKTADGKYAKMEILSYYHGNPSLNDIPTKPGRYYTFRFIYQPDGTTNLKDTQGE